MDAKIVELQKNIIEFNELFNKYIKTTDTVGTNFNELMNTIDIILTNTRQLNNDNDYIDNILKNMNNIKIKLFISEEIKKITDDDVINVNTIINELIQLFIPTDTKEKNNFELIKNIKLFMEHRDTVNNKYENNQPPKDIFVLSSFNKDLTEVNTYLTTFCVKEDTNMFILITNLLLFETYTDRFTEINNGNLTSDHIIFINSLMILNSYFETTLKTIKMKLQTFIINKRGINYITDICEYIISLFDNYFIPLELNLNFTSTDMKNFKKYKLFDNYILNNIKIYNPSPCKTFDEMEKHKRTIFDTKYKQNYTFYNFSNENEVYYYSIFYKINLTHFLYQNVPKLPNNTNNPVYQCLIMNSTFEGNDLYKYGKFLFFLNKILFPKPEVEKSPIICFINNTKNIVDKLFDYLDNIKLFSDSIGSRDSKPQNIKIFEIENDISQYLKYDNVSFYTKPDENISYINLIYEKLNN